MLKSNFEWAGLGVGIFLGLVGIYYPIVLDVVTNGPSIKGELAFGISIAISIMGCIVILVLFSRAEMKA